MDVLSAIKNRASYRAFLPKPVPKETIIAILETARWAPSGVNTQPWHVVVVSDEKRKAIGDAIIAARESNIPENPDYNYYPKTWREPYKSRRKACGLALYSAIGINFDEVEKRKEAWYRNYYFFHAPAGLLFSIDSDCEKGSWVDMGMFIQNIMLAARGHGLETCPQAALAEYPDIVREIVGIPSEQHLICGMALGYADKDAPINNYRTERIEVEEFTKWI